MCTHKRWHAPEVDDRAGAGEDLLEHLFRDIVRDVADCGSKQMSATGGQSRQMGYQRKAERVEKQEKKSALLTAHRLLGTHRRRSVPWPCPRAPCPSSFLFCLDALPLRCLCQHLPHEQNGTHMVQRTAAHGTATAEEKELTISERYQIDPSWSAKGRERKAWKGGSEGTRERMDAFASRILGSGALQTGARLNTSCAWRL